MGAAAASGVISCQSFQSVTVAGQGAASQRNTPFRFAYISDSHLYEKKVNDCFARALLRDMIHLCIDNSVRGRHLGPDDPAMRALEAYITTQRSGTSMNYGKH